MQVQITMDARQHRTLKYRAAQAGLPMGRFVEEMLAGLKQRALRAHKRLGVGTFVDDAIIIRALIENDRRGGSEADALDLIAVDLFDAEQDGVEATFEEV